MVLYPFNFTFDGKTYSAKFEKIPVFLPVLFHVFEIEPNDLGLPDLLTFTSDNTPNGLSWVPCSPNHYTIMAAIAKAIIKKCAEESISIFD